MSGGKGGYVPILSQPQRGEHAKTQQANHWASLEAGCKYKDGEMPFVGKPSGLQIEGGNLFETLQ